MTLQEILERRAAIAVELESPEANLVELRAELVTLENAENRINEATEMRNSLLSQVANTENGSIIRGGAAMPQLEERTFDLDSAEYRSAFFNHLAGNTLTDIETRAMTVTDFNGALPTVTANRIYSLIQRDHSILQDIDIFALGSQFEITVVKSVKTGKAKKTTENETNVEMTFNEVKYTLSGNDYTDWAGISYALGTMNGQDLEDYLVTELYDSIGDAIADDIITMIIADTHTDNKVELTEVEFANLTKLFGKVAHKGEIKTYLNNTVLYEHLVSMVNKDGTPIFQPNANIKAEGAFVGSTLRTESSVAKNQIIIGVPQAIVGNWVTKPMIERDKDIKAGKLIFAGYSRFEAKLRNDLAFVVVTIKPGAGA